MTTKLKILLILSLITFTTAVCSYIFMLERITTSESDYTDISQNLEKAKTNLTSLNRIENNLRGVLSLQSELNKHVLTKSDIVVFIQGIESLISTVGLSGSVDSVSEDTGDAQGPKSRVSLTIKVTGDWSKIVRFTSLLETLPYKAGVDSFNLIYDKIDTKDAKGKVSSRTAWQESVRLYVWVSTQSNTTQ